MSASSRITKLKTGGFTLVEIQIALVLLVLIMGLLFGALHLAARSWRTGQAQNELIEEKRLVAEFLRRQISQITPMFWSDNRGSDLIFRGNEDSMLYVGKLPANRNNGGLSLLELITRENFSDGSSKRLELGYGNLSTDHTPFDTRDERLKHTLVLDQIKDIHFQYFGKQKVSTRTSEWSDSWQSKKLLPRLIKCQITLANGDEWPEMILPTYVDNTSGFRQFILQASLNNRIHPNNKAPSNNSDQGIEELF